MDRVGYYCWAGPDTIRMLNLKFFNPGIDTQSLLASYDYDYLAKVKEKFGITDFWAMYDWGFKPESQREQYDFLLSRLDNFHKLNIRVHGYIQGPNVVESEFPDRNWYCLDNLGHRVTYYRGRKVVCLNNPEFMEYKLRVLQNMLDSDLDGIYMDNIQMGQYGVLKTSHGYVGFAGCNCQTCRRLFRQDYNLDIPLDLSSNPDVATKYLDFRTNTTTKFLQKIASLIKPTKKQFGTNSFDPKFGSNFTYGTDLKQLEKIQDYLLFENHSLPDETQNNQYIEKLDLQKPVFVVSYKDGIGQDKSFPQQDFNNIYTEDKRSDFFACYKGCEYYTDGKWHNLEIDTYQKPQVNSRLDLKYFKNKESVLGLLVKFPLVKFIISRYFNTLITIYMNSKLIRLLGGKIFSIL